MKRNQSKARRFFLSGSDEKVNAEVISHYLQQRGFTLLKVFQSKRKGTVSAKLHVSLADSTTILQDNFCPKYVRCRCWLSKGKMENVKKLGERVDHVATISTLV